MADRHFYLGIIMRSFCAAASAALAMLLSSLPAHAVSSGLAVDYTDTWYTVGEEGWGVTLFQSDITLYGLFFIYGADKKPTWFNAVTAWDGNSKYVGKVFSQQGSYFAGPWNQSEQIEAEAGTVSFQPDPANSSLGTLTYTITGVGTVTKPLQRLSLTPIPVTGTYVGGQAGAYTGCANNSIYQDQFFLQISQSAGIASLSFAYGGQLNCSFVGTMTQNGTLHSISSATYKCDDGLNTGASMTDIKITAQGIEGRFTAPDVGGGCREDARFSAVLY